MNIFHLRKQFFIFLVLLLLGMALLQILNKNLKQDPLFLFSEIQTISVNFHNGTSNFIQKYFFLLNLREINKKLKKQNEELSARLQFFEEALKENDRLKRLLQFPLNQPFDLIPAQITGTDFLAKNELLTINKGSTDGIKKFMGVVSPEGVVGYIFRTSPHSSQVISLLNPLSSLPARNRRSRVSGLISTYQKGQLIFNFLDREFPENSDDLKIGDVIVTVQSDQFPPGFLVGSLSALNYSLENLNPEAYVQPAVKFHALEEVLVVLNPSPNSKLLTNSFLQKEPESN